MARIIVWPYHMRVSAARHLAEKFDTFMVYPDRNYRPRTSDVILNWGNSSNPTSWSYLHPHNIRVINRPSAVCTAINKRVTLQVLSNANLSNVPFTVDRGEAIRWAHQGCRVVCRHRLTGYDGQGIEIVSDPLSLPRVPLYTQYIKKRREYRVHVVQGDTLVYRKCKRRGFDSPNTDVRSWHNGWNFCHTEDTDLPTGIKELGVAAVRALGLQLGAVDVIWNAHHDRLYVLEVNTAPGIEGSTIDWYATRIQECARTM